MKKMVKSGISQIGGKFRLRKPLLDHTPYHEFFLSLFSGSCIYELNKPRCRYELFNDKDAKIINYLLVIERYPKEFDEFKKGPFGLVSQEICNRIINGELVPKDNIERAYFFYYLNKLCYGGTPTKGFAGLNQNKAIPQTTFHKKDIKEIKKTYKGLQPPGHQVRKTDVKKAKASYRGVILPTVCKEKSINEAKASYKGINPKTTRPYQNNDCGLLTPIDPGAIKRLQYVNITCYDFKRVYKLFFRAFHEKKTLSRECFLYIDRPYPGTEKYYGNKFKPEDHENLNNLVVESPFHIMESLGGECEEIIDFYKDAGLIIKEVYTRYSTDANSQDLTKEYLIMNYDLKKVPKMIIDNQPNLMNFMEV